MVHSSGGPLMDIVETAEGSRTGYLAVDAMDYANSIAAILYNSKEDNNAIREAARWIGYDEYRIKCNWFQLIAFHSLIHFSASVDRFSEEEFKLSFIRATTLLFDHLK